MCKKQTTDLDDAFPEVNKLYSASVSKRSGAQKGKKTAKAALAADYYPYLPCGGTEGMFVKGGEAPLNMPGMPNSDGIHYAVDYQGAMVHGLVKAKAKRQKHVQKACVHCKRAHLACDNERPCRRCVHLGKTDCVDVEHKRRGRPKSSPEKRKVMCNSQSTDSACKVDCNHASVSMLPTNLLSMTHLCNTFPFGTPVFKE